MLVFDYEALDMVKKSPAYKNRLRALELERSGDNNVDSYSDKSADSKQRFSDGSTYPWDALPINELDDKDEQLLDDLDKFSNMDSEQSFSDGSTYSWDALPINELDVKVCK
ncbi:hypothetical protein AgCh_000154 [Apium graveolens]